MLILNSKEKISVSAILGPTNTGKTYQAFEKFLSYNSGIFGFPLRLLARENYDKAIKRIDINKVALVTGEEKIIPKTAKYFFCTVESMPLDIAVECIIIDEVQLAADYERGHIFTDRILNARGSIETIFLGSLTIKNILKKIFPTIRIENLKRFSKLSFSNKKNFSKLQPRSALIAFNVNKVYEIAEALRQLKGGTAVVLGSLSPRTRNAQVEVYENKQVDYLVATDAIGMGLNLNINHVSFSSIHKFDGRYNRNLFSDELGQIAGRAGRYKNDGTFGFSRDVGSIDQKIIQSIEEHNFNDVNKIYWRNSKIDFTSVNSVINSLKEYPIKDYFIHKKNAEDEINFKFLSRDKEIISYLCNETSTKLLWDVCRIPDFQKIMNDSYLDLLKKIFLILINNDLKIPESWLNDKIERLDRFSGGIDELTSKIANIRTWTYISNQSNWLENNEFWKDKTRNIEDTLSDKLHESLTNRFVDFSALYFFGIKNEGEEPKIEIDNNKSIKLNGQNYGYINGFNLKLTGISNSNSLFSIKNVKKTIRSMIKEKFINFIEAPNDSINLGNINDFNLNEKVNIYWGDESIGFLKKGRNIFSPIAETINSELLDNENKKLVTDKLQKWIDDKILTLLKPLKDDLGESISSNVRKISFNLFDSLGTMEVSNFQNEIKNLKPEEKLSISKLGIRIGAKYFFMPNFLKKNAMEINSFLWKIFFEPDISEKYPLPKDGRVSFFCETKMPLSYWNAIGYIFIKNFALRVDVFERVFFLARQKIKFGPFIESSDLMNPMGCNSDDLSNILYYCGFDNIALGNQKKLFFLIQKKSSKLKSKNTKNKKKKDQKITKILPKEKKIKSDPNSPFAVLQKLL